MNAARTYDYLLKSRESILVAARSLTPEQYVKTFPFGLKSIAATLTHIMTSEWYYIERLSGRVVPPYSEWPIKEETPPPLDVLEAAWTRQTPGVREAITRERDWSRSITWHSFPNEQGKRFYITASAADFFTQLALHEVHHRAQVMVMLRDLGRPVEDIDFNALMFHRVPA